MLTGSSSIPSPSKNRDQTGHSLSTGCRLGEGLSAIAGLAEVAAEIDRMRFQAERELVGATAAGAPCKAR
jgi:hypothetical protein